jgi:acyl dehydratase
MTVSPDSRPELYLDDLAVGMEFVSDEIEITVADIVAYGEMFDPQPFHTDPEAAKGSFFGGLAASGWHTAGLTMRMLVTGGPRLAGGTIGAGGNISWPSPTRPGDRLHVKVSVEAVTPSKSRPDRGMIAMRVETRTSEGELRQLFLVDTLAFRKRA